jgi:hypothetical protein
LAVARGAVGFAGGVVHGAYEVVHKLPVSASTAGMLGDQDVGLLRQAARLVVGQREARSAAGCSRRRFGRGKGKGGFMHGLSVMFSRWHGDVPQLSRVKHSTGARLQVYKMVQKIL